jgi:hypothetical protein
VRRSLLSLLIAVAVVLAVAPVVIAQRSSGDDPRGDVLGEPAGGADSADLVRATADQGTGDALWHKVTIAGAAADPAAGGIVPQVLINVRERPNGTAECDFFVGRHDDRLGVFECGYATRVAKAKVVRTSAHSIRYTFDADAIGDPAQYDWRIWVRGPSDGTQVTYDSLPDNEAVFRTHRVR